MEDSNTQNTTKINRYIITVFSRLKALINPVDRLILKTPLSNIPSTQRRILIIVLIFFTCIFTLLVVVGMLFQLTNREQVTTKLLPGQVDPVQQRNQVARNPSVYANDEAILNLEKSVSELEQELNALDILNSRLSPPILFYEIEF